MLSNENTCFQLGFLAFLLEKNNVKFLVRDNTSLSISSLVLIVAVKILSSRAIPDFLRTAKHDLSKIAVLQFPVRGAYELDELISLQPAVSITFSNSFVQVVCVTR